MGRYKLSTETVRRMVLEKIADLGLYGTTGDEAGHLASYIAGMVDMANEVIHAIEELEGKRCVKS